MFNLEKNKRILEQEGNKYTLEETKIITALLNELIAIQGTNLKTSLDYDKESSIDGTCFE